MFVAKSLVRSIPVCLKLRLPPWFLLPLCVVWVTITLVAAADELVPANPPLRWWKGNIHTHTFWSDGNDFPEMVAEWYRTHGYNFLALSDHNILSEGQRWMSVETIEKRGGAEVIPKYMRRFGDTWVEMRPTTDGGPHEVRLKPLDEFRALVEERGRFLMVVGEEISDSVQGKPVHMNATNLSELLLPLSGTTVSEAMRANLRAAQDQADRLGREIVVHLNHPNFYYAITAEDLAAVVEERFFEVYNGHPSVNHQGDDEHPSVERIWDLANTIRLVQYNAEPLMGVATDDSHAYHGTEGSTPGRGWIMVEAHFLTPESLVKAMKRGRFYASSGVTLSRMEFDQTKRQLLVTIDAENGVNYTTEFIGTRRAGDREMPPGEAIGTVLASVEGVEASYTLQGDELYVRAVVTADKAHSNPSFPDQRIQAWTPPVGWDLEK